MPKQHKQLIQKVEGRVRGIRDVVKWFVRTLIAMPDGAVEIIVRLAKKDKSAEQLGAIFGLAIAQIIAEFNDNGYDTSYLLNLPNPTGIGITTDLLKEYLYAVCPIFDDDGKRLTLSRASTAQAAKFFDDIRNFASSQWGIVIPEPDKNWRLK